ncbi:MAG: hypothetical protein P8M32_05445 [Phycisphaerales bacterium]|nr:hypothetical protein [Phycisphaerales bacterium]
MLFHMLIPAVILASPSTFFDAIFDGGQSGTLPLSHIDRPLGGRSADGTVSAADEPRWGKVRACCDMPDWDHAWSEDGTISLVIGGYAADEKTPVLAAVNSMTFRMSIFQGDVHDGPVKVFDMRRTDEGTDQMDLLANTPIRRPDKAYRPRSGCVLPGCVLMYCSRSRLIESGGEFDWACEGVSVIAVFEGPNGWFCQHVYDGPTIGGTNQWDGWQRGYSSSMANYYPTRRGERLTEAFIPFVDYMNHIPSPAGAGQCFLMKAVRDGAGELPWQFEGPVLLHEFNGTPPLHAHAAAWTPRGVLLGVGDGANSDVRLLTCDDWSDWTNLDQWSTHERMHGGPLVDGGATELSSNQFWSTSPGPDENTVLIGGDNVSTPIMSAHIPVDSTEGVCFDALWGQQPGDPFDGGNTQATCSLLVADQPEHGGPVLARVYLERAQSSVSDARLLISRDQQHFATVAKMPRIANKVSGVTVMGQSIVAGLLQAVETRGLWVMPLPSVVSTRQGMLIEPAGIDLLRVDTTGDVSLEPGAGTEVTPIFRGGDHEFSKLAVAAPGVGNVWRVRRESPSSPTVASLELPFDSAACMGDSLQVRAWVCNLAPGMLRMEERLEVGSFSSTRKIALATRGHWRPATIMSAEADLPAGYCPQFRLLTSSSSGEHPPVDFLLTLDGAFSNSFGQWTPSQETSDAEPPAERVSQVLPDVGEQWTVSMEILLPESGLDRGLGWQLPRWSIGVIHLKGGDLLHVYALPQSEQVSVDLIRNGESIETVTQIRQRLNRLDTLHIEVTGGPGRLGLRSRCGGDSTVEIDWPFGATQEMSGSPRLLQWGDLSGTILAPIEVLSVSVRGAMLDVDMGFNPESGILFGPCPGDMTGDDIVDVNDLLALAAAWGPCTDDPCLPDVTGDDIVDTSDLLYLLASWGPCETN